MLWSISLHRANGGFFSVGFGVVGAGGLQVARLLMVYECLCQKGSRCSALACEGLCLVLALVAFVLVYWVMV